MSSYLARLLDGRDDAKTFLVKSFTFLSGRTGIKPTPAQIDPAVEAVDKATDAAENAFRVLIQAKYPGIPASIATAAVTAGLNMIDAAVAGAGEALKKSTP